MFADSEFTAVGVAKLLQAAQVQAPTLYHHFEDKEGLFVVWAELAFGDLGIALTPSGGEGAEPLESFARTLGEWPHLHLLKALDSVKSLTRTSSQERVLRAYFDSVYEPCCMMLLSKVDEGLLTFDHLGQIAGQFLMGTLAASSRYSLPATISQPEYSRFVRQFVTAHRTGIDSK